MWLQLNWFKVYLWEVSYCTEFNNQVAVSRLSLGIFYMEPVRLSSITLGVGATPLGWVAHLHHNVMNYVSLKNSLHAHLLELVCVGLRALLPLLQGKKVQIHSDYSVLSQKM